MRAGSFDFSSFSGSCFHMGSDDFWIETAQISENSDKREPPP